ncbi:hypothetical protein COCOBI_07-1920 [Coccomyxa sp. Obi]|nr:hypothetical protein COCOBI_07-1920 [Coccomyxa sp. Obi]
MSFNNACMQVLQRKLEAICPHGPGFDRITSRSIRPILLETFESLKAALRMCPLLQIVQWQPHAGIDSREALPNSVSALMGGCCLHLTHVSFVFCNLPNAAMSVLGQSKSLQALSLRHSHVMSFEIVLDRRDYTRQDHEKVWRGFPQLRCLDVSWSHGVYFCDLLQVAPQLLSLTLHGCDGVHGPLCKHLRNCVCLDICGTGIQDGDLSALTEAAPHLKYLYISDRYANLWSDPLWTDGAMSEFRRRRPDVVVRTITSPHTPSEYERLGSK